MIPTSFVDASQSGSVTAKYAAASVSAPLTIRPVGVLGVALTPDAITGGGTVLGLVVLEARAPKAIPVTLTDNLASASAPAAITVPAGATRQSFTVKTTAVTATKDGVLTAAAAGGSWSVPFTVERALVRCTGLGFGKLRTYPSLGGRTVVAADFNHDNKFDLAVLSPYKVYVMPGNGTGVFGKVVRYKLTRGADRRIAVGDFNKDGIANLVQPVWYHFGYVMLGKGAGAMGEQTPISEYRMQFVTGLVAVGDFNKDGSQDLAFTQTAWGLAIAMGTGKGDFVLPSSLYTGAGGDSELLVRDMNGDRIEDLVTVNPDYTVSILQGDGTGNFQAPFKTVPVARYIEGFDTPPVGMKASDFNGDGRLDIVAPSYWGSTINVLLSACQ